MKIRDRIKEVRKVRAGDLLPNPRNWRTHPQNQKDALKGVLAEIGMADVLLAYETPEGLMLIDGHARAEASPDTEWTVAVLDVDDREAATILATLDPLAAMAGADAAQLDALLHDVNTGSAAVQEMLGKLAADSGLYPVDLSTEWEGMPECENEDVSGVQHIIVHFEKREDVKDFAKLIGQSLTDKTKSIWYPYVAPKKMPDDTEL